MKSDWTSTDIPDLSGKVALVTGANIGLGLEITKRLAQNGATVIMACRTVSKADSAKAQLIEELSGTPLKIETMQLDVSSFASVREFSAAFKKRFNALDMLMLNAGVMALEERQLSADGFEMQFATNHLGHFLLTSELLPLLQKSSGSRVVAQSSSANWMGKFNFEDLNCEKAYDPWGQYAMTKLSNVAFIYELQNKLTAAGVANPVCCVAHPGYVYGQLQEKSKASGLEGLFMSVGRYVAGTYETGALPSLFALTSNEAQPGNFYGPNGFFGGIMAGNHPAVVTPNKLGVDAEVIKKLWDISTKLTKANYKI